MKTDVYQVPASATVSEAVSLMLAKHTSGLPVTDGDKRVVGFVSDGDVIRALAPEGSAATALAVYRGDEAFDRRLAEVMGSNVMDIATTQVVALDAGDTIERACRVLGAGRLKKAPVLSRGALVGPVSRTDVNRWVMTTFVRLGETGRRGDASARRPDERPARG